jgi:hypothetical protein
MRDSEKTATSTDASGSGTSAMLHATTPGASDARIDIHRSLFQFNTFIIVMLNASEGISREVVHKLAAGSGCGFSRP